MIHLIYKTAEGDKSIEYDPQDERNLLDVGLENKIAIDHACGGNAACSTCHVKIKSGMEDLSEIDEIEEDLIDFAEDADLTSRLACQCIPSTSAKQNIIIELPEQKGLH